MSKYTKIIAALGVAAGMGVASLPFGAVFADEGGVIIKTDANTGTNADGTKDNKVSIDLGIEVAIEDVLTLKLDHKDSDDANAANTNNLVKTSMAAGALNTSMSTTANVFTNSKFGYTLTLKAAANAGGNTYDDGILRHADHASHTTGGTIDAEYRISPIADATQDGKSGWSVSFHKNESFDATSAAAAATEAAMPANNTATPILLLDKDTPSVADGDHVAVTYNIHTATNQAAGTYTGKVTYTAEARTAAAVRP